MIASRSAWSRALALAGATLAASVAAAPAHALTAQEEFLIALPTSVTQTTTQPRTATPPPFCPRFNVVVARGTDQAANQDEALDGRPYWTEGVFRGGPDSAVGSWWKIASELYFPTVGTARLTEPNELLRTDLTYLASNDLATSGPGGTANLILYLNRINQFCPATRFVLLGFSQGAQVIGDTLSAPSRRTLWFSGTQQLTTATTNAIAAVGLIGNPGFNRRQPMRDRSDFAGAPIVGTFRDTTWLDTSQKMNDGDFNPAYSGVAVRSLTAYPVRAVPVPLLPGTKASDYIVNPALTVDVASKIRDYCKAGDYICQWGSLSSSVARHQLYKPDPTPKKNLAVFAIEKLKPLL